MKNWKKYQEYLEKGDWHVHTNYTDGKNTVLEYCEQAEKNELKLIVFAEHVRKKLDYNFDKFLSDVQSAKDKFNLIILVGCEAKMIDLKGTLDVSKDICLLNQGVYTFMPLIWGGKPLSLKEEHCCFEGAPYCEYHLKWPARNRFHEIFSRFFSSKSVLMETISEMEEGKEIIEQKYEEVNRLNVELNQKIRQLMAIQETGKAILSVLDLGQLLTVIMNILSNVCQINRAIIMLVNEKEGYLEYIHGIGFDAEVPGQVKNYRVRLDRVSNILVRVTNTGRSEYVPDVRSSSLRKDNVILTYGNPSSVYVVPLITRSKVIGVLATDAVAGEGVPEETRKTLEIFSPQIAIAIQNARLYSRLQEQMMELKTSHDQYLRRHAAGPVVSGCR